MFDSALPGAAWSADLAAVLSDVLAAGSLAACHRLAADALGRQVPVESAPAPTRKAKAGMTAEAFYDARLAATRAACADLGDGWALVPGASGWAVIPPGLRAFKTTHGARVRMPDVRMPAARYWIGGLPSGVEFEASTNRPAWLVRYLLPDPKGHVAAEEARERRNRQFDRDRDAEWRGQHKAELEAADLARKVALAAAEADDDMEEAA